MPNQRRHAVYERLRPATRLAAAGFQGLRVICANERQQAAVIPFLDQGLTFGTNPCSVGRVLVVRIRPSRSSMTTDGAGAGANAELVHSLALLLNQKKTRRLLHAIFPPYTMTGKIYMKPLTFPRSTKAACNNDLDGVPEEGGVVALLSFRHALLLGVLAGRLVLAVAARILAAEIDGHEERENQRHKLAGQQGGVAGVVLRAVLGDVEVGRNGTAEIAEAYVHSDADTTLERAANVVAVPGHTLRHVGVDTGSQEEATGVLDSGVLGRNQHDEADDAVLAVSGQFQKGDSGSQTYAMHMKNIIKLPR